MSDTPLLTIAHSPTVRRSTATLCAIAVLLTGCGVTGSVDDAPIETTAPTETTIPAPSTSGTPTTDDPSTGEPVTGIFDTSMVHQLSIDVDQAAYDTLIDAYTETGDKEWAEVTVTIDGVVYNNAGIRLKGNSSLRGLTSEGGQQMGFEVADASSPETLPWLVRLDRNVAGQHHEGVSEFVVRSNRTASSLNEAVALDLLAAAGLATQQATAVSFTVNGSEPTLRLVIENPDEVWLAEAFPDDGILYKADAEGSYEYRGSDPDAYLEAFDVEAGVSEDYTPLVEFLDFVNNADDATFTAELPGRLDVEAFARYLALQDLIANDDDIEGPGNNSYLFYDIAAEQFTVVAWDHNLAFGGIGSMAGNRGGGQGEGPPMFADSERPDLGQRPADGSPPPLPGGRFPGSERDRGIGPGARTNPLVTRFLADTSFRAMYDQAMTDLADELYESGYAAEVLDRWVTLIEDGAPGLVDTAALASEAETIAAFFRR